MYASFGFPILAESQTGLLNPLGMLFFFISDPITAFSLLMVSGVLIALFGSWALFRELGFDRGTSVFLSVTYGFSGFFIYHLMHINIILPASYFPLTLFLCIRILNTDKRKMLHIPALALTIALQAISGTFQYALYNIIFCIILSVVLTGHKTSRRSLLLMCLVIAGGIMLASLQLFSTIELVSLSERQQGLDPEEISQKSYPPFSLITYIYPYSFGFQRPSDIIGYGFRTPSYYGPGAYWDINSYMGLTSIILFFILILNIFGSGLENRRIILILLFLLFLTYLIMMGKYSPFFGVLAKIPVLSYFRGLSRLIYIFNLILLILSGYALKAIGEKRVRKSSFPAAAFALLFIHLIIDAFFRHVLQGYSERLPALISHLSYFNSLSRGFYNRTLVFGLISAALLYLFYRYPKLIFALILFNIIDIYSINSSYNTCTETAEALSEPVSVSAIKKTAYFPRIANAIRRPLPWLDTDNLKSSVSLIWNVSDVFLPSPLLPVKLKLFLEDNALLYHPFLLSEKIDRIFDSLSDIRSAGITHIILPSDYLNRSKAPGIKTVYSDDHIGALEIGAEPLISIYPSGFCSFSSISPDGYTVSYRTGTLNEEAESSILIRYMQYPGWRFSLSGQEIIPSAYNDIFYRIPVPSGSGELKAEYIPGYYKLSLYIIIFIVAMSIIILYLFEFNH